MKEKIVSSLVTSSVLFVACSGSPNHSSSNVASTDPTSNDPGANTAQKGDTQTVQDPNLEYGTEADGVKIIKDMELFNEKAKNDDGTYDFSKMKLGSDGNWYTPSPYEKGENVEMCKICKCVCDCVCVVCKIDIHNPMKGVIDSIGKSVGRNGQFVAAARGGGWTKDNCVGNGISLSGAIAALYSAPICAAIGVGLGAPACMAAVGAAGAAITGIACTQLCNDGNLRGADCGNP